jgi:hypothetical protein
VEASEGREGVFGRRNPIGEGLGHGGEQLEQHGGEHQTSSTQRDATRLRKVICALAEASWMAV